MLTDLPIVLAAGLGAGLATGLFGASAVNVIAPVLILVIAMPPYQAIGLSLGADIMASVTGALVYHRHDNLRVGAVRPLLLVSLLGALVGSSLSSYIPGRELAAATGIGVLLTGAIFLYEAWREHRVGGPEPLQRAAWLRRLAAFPVATQLVAGLWIGLIAGLLGAGGGLLLLLLLSIVLGYTMHEAIGTAILLMAAIALVGCVAHYLVDPFPALLAAGTALGAVVGASLSARLANRLPENLLRFVAGTAFATLGTALVMRAALERFG